MTAALVALSVPVRGGLVHKAQVLTYVRAASSYAADVCAAIRADRAMPQRLDALSDKYRSARTVDLIAAAGAMELVASERMAMPPGHRFTAAEVYEWRRLSRSLGDTEQAVNDAIQTVVGWHGYFCWIGARAVEKATEKWRARKRAPPPTPEAYDFDGLLADVSAAIGAGEIILQDWQANFSPTQYGFEEAVAQSDAPEGTMPQTEHERHGQLNTWWAISWSMLGKTAYQSSLGVSNDPVQYPAAGGDFKVNTVMNVEKRLERLGNVHGAIERDRDVG